MKLRALALDYDGTIAAHNRLEPLVRAAIDRAREGGLVVLLVTGRLLGDLRRVAGDLTFVDAVVAENGAVVAFPRIGRSTALHIAPSPRFLDELRRRGIHIEVGNTVIEADAGDGPAVLDAIRTLEQPLSLLFNRGRMMILPQGVSKGTGLTSALDALRLSAHNTLAIGDAENDHELLRAAEVGVAVDWGSAALKQIADEVLPGDGPSAVAGYIDSLCSRSAQGRGLQIKHPRRHAVLGTTMGGECIALGVSGRNVLISGDPRSGKSWAAGLLCEQLILHGYSVCVIDPEGDYSSLEALPRVMVVGGGNPPPKAHELLCLLRQPDRSLVIDLSQLPHVEKQDYLKGALSQIVAVRRRTGLPHRVLIDEAHYWLRGPDALSLLDLESGGCTAITYQASGLHPDVLRAFDIVLVSRANDLGEIAVLAQAAGAPSPGDDWLTTLSNLAIDEVALLPGPAEAGGQLRRVKLIDRLTPHTRHRMKYLDMPVACHQGFIFASGGRHTGERAHTLREFVAVVEKSPPDTLDEHIRRSDFSKWIAGVFGDKPLAAIVQRLEENYRLGRVPDVNDALVQTIRERYELNSEPAT